VLKNISFNLSKEPETLFVHTDGEYTIGEKKVNLILSPAFYWCRREKVGVKNARSAKKIAHSVFESNIPAGEYKYIARKTKKEGEFLFFAYDEEKILKKLLELGINSNKINNTYFAQTEFDNIETPLKITERSALIVADSIVSVIPAEFAGEMTELDFNSIRLSKKRVGIRRYNSLGIKASKIYTLSAVAALFSIILLFENRYYRSYLDIETKKGEDMLKKASLPTTKFQLESIKKSLKKRETENIDLKKEIMKFADIANEDDITIEEIRITTGNIFVAYSSKKITDVQQMIKKSYPKAKVAQSNDRLKVEIAR